MFQRVSVFLATIINKIGIYITANKRLRDRLNCNRQARHRRDTKRNRQGSGRHMYRSEQRQTGQGPAASGERHGGRPCENESESQLPGVGSRGVSTARGWSAYRYAAVTYDPRWGCFVCSLASQGQLRVRCAVFAAARAVQAQRARRPHLIRSPTIGRC